MIQTRSMIGHWDLFGYKKRYYHRVLSNADKFRDKKNYHEAAALYQAYLDYYPYDFDINIQCGHMLKEAGKVDSAEIYYLSALRLNPLNAEINLQLGHFYRKIGRLYAAVDSYRRYDELTSAQKTPPELLSCLREISNSSETSNPHSNRGNLAQSDSIMPIQHNLEYALASLSQTFDSAAYIDANPDLGHMTMDPLDHFLTYGLSEGRPLSKPEITAHDSW